MHLVLYSQISDTAVIIKGLACSQTSITVSIRRNRHLLLAIYMYSVVVNKLSQSDVHVYGNEGQVSGSSISRMYTVRWTCETISTASTIYAHVPASTSLYGGPVGHGCHDVHICDLRMCTSGICGHAHTRFADMQLFPRGFPRANHVETIACPQIAYVQVRKCTV